MAGGLRSAFALSASECIIIIPFRFVAVPTKFGGGPIGAIPIDKFISLHVLMATVRKQMRNGVELVRIRLVVVISWFSRIEKSADAE